MEMTRRQLIMGALAAMLPAARPRPVRPDDPYWWMDGREFYVDWVVTDQPDALVYGYLDDAGVLHYFAGDAARAEMARQATLAKTGPRFLQQVQS